MIAYFNDKKTYLFYAILGQGIFMFLEDIIAECMESIKYWISHSRSGLTHDTERFLNNDKQYSNSFASAHNIRPFNRLRPYQITIIRIVNVRDQYVAEIM